MGSVTLVQGARTSLTCTDLSTAASGSYKTSNAYQPATNDPVDVIIELEIATTNTPSGNKQCVVFLVESLDGTNYREPNTITTTNEHALLPLGVVPIPTTANTERGTFSIAAVLGYVPQYFKVVVKNDLGVALTTGALYTAEISVVTA